MKRGWGVRPIRLRSIKSSRGYTIVESLIFLAVSGAMATAVMMLIAGQQGRAEFQSAIREFEVILQDVSNDIETGFSSASGSNCRFNGNDAQLLPPSSGNRCVFVGKVLQFGVDGDDSKLAIHTVVGRQRTPAGQEATTLSSAQAQVLPGGVEVKALRSMRVVYVRAAGLPDLGAFGYLTTFRDYQLGGGDLLTSGSIGMDVIPIRPNIPGVGNTQANVTTDIRNNWVAPVINPGGGVTICLQSLGSNQWAKIVVGGASGRSSAPTAVIGGSDTVCTT